MSMKSLREKAGLSQQGLGELLAREAGGENADPKYFQPRVSAYETGRNRIPLPVAMSIVKVLNAALKKAKVKERATVEDLLHESQAPKKKPRR